MNRIAQVLSGVPLAATLTVLAYASIYLTQMSFFADDPGVGWHLKTGELIRESLVIPRIDPFLASEPRMWIADQWLSDLILFSVFHCGGWELLYVSLAGVWIVCFFGILLRALRRQVGSIVASLVAVTVAFKCAQVHFILRPVVFSILCFACAFVISRVLSRPGPLGGRTILLNGSFLCLLFAIWSNLHPAFVLGLFVVLLVPASRILRSDRCFSDIFGLSVVAGLCALITCVNPYGTDLHKSIVWLGQSRYFMSLNSEWLPPEIWSFEWLVLAGFVVLPGLAALTSSSFRKRVGWFDLLATGCLAFAAFRSVRFMPFAVIAGVFPLAEAFVSLAVLSKIPGLGLSAACVRALERREVTRSYGELSAYLCALIGVLGSRFMPLPNILGPQPTRYPPSLLQAIRADSPGGVVLASPDLGGFITANLYPSFRAVIDDRNALIGEELYQQYFQSLKSIETLKDVTERFRVTHVVLPKGSAVGQEMASERRWPILLDDGKSLVVRVMREY